MARHIWIDRLLERACKANATELRLRTGQPPMMYVGEQFVRMNEAELTAEDMQTYLGSITPDAGRQSLERDGHARFQFDFGTAVRVFVLARESAGDVELRLRPVRQRYER